MAAAARRGVGEDLAAAPGHELRKGPGLSVDPGGGVHVFMMVLDSTIMNVAGSTGPVQVKHHHPPGARAGIKHRHRARLARRLRGKRPRMPGRVGAAAITGNPDMRSARDRSRDGTPGGLRGGAREAIRAVRVHQIDTRRVARGRC